MDPQPSRIPASDRAGRRWGVLSLLALAFLPLAFARTSPTVSEDVAILLLLVAAVFWWRRGWPLPTSLRLIVDFLLFGFFSVLVWRNQLDLAPEWGRLSYWPVFCLAGAACLAGGHPPHRSQLLKLLPAVLLLSLIGLVLSQLILPATLPDPHEWPREDGAGVEIPIENLVANLPDQPHWYSLDRLVPPSLVVLGLFALGLIIQSEEYVARRRLYVAVPLLFGLIAGAGGCRRDAVTLGTWWKASALERSVQAWQGEQAETARETRRLYSRVSNTLEERGGHLVQSSGLDRVLHFRLAELAKRMHQPGRMLTAMPPRIWSTPQGSRLLTDLWTASELTRLRETAADTRYMLSLRSWLEPSPWQSYFESDQIPGESPPPRYRLEFRLGLYADHEISPDGSVAWLLDRWGRVFRSQSGSLLEPVWEAAPGEGRSDAADLEIWDGMLAVAFSNGELRLSAEPPAWLSLPCRIPLRAGEWLVDIERHPIRDGLLALSSRGRITVIGDLPDDFPIPEASLFPEPYAVDLEISPDGLGWYVLDTFGGVHVQSGGEPIPLPTEAQERPFSTVKAPYAPYWPRQEMALDIELDPLGRGFCLLNRLGEAWTVTVPRFRPVYRPFEGEETMGLGVSLALRQDGAMVLLWAAGNLVTVQ